MNEPSRRLWGIDVIAAIYGVATVLLLWLCFNGTTAGRAFGLILAPFSALLCVGIALRANAARIALMILLAISVVCGVLLTLYFLGVLADLFPGPPNKDPRRELIRMPLQFATAILMLLYLRRADVRAAFQRSPSPAAGEVERGGVDSNFDCSR